MILLYIFSAPILEDIVKDIIMLYEFCYCVAYSTHEKIIWREVHCEE